MNISKNFLLLNSSLLLFMLLFSSCSGDDEIQTDEITVTTADLIVSIMENPENGQFIGNVNGSTNSGNISFSIDQQFPQGAFTIDENTGELTVGDATLFDFETNPIITGTVKVGNGNIFENAEVTINLIDINEDNVFDGTINLKTQEEVNAFGANNYTHITGQLVLGIFFGDDYSDIVDLSPLNSLESIGRDLYIMANADLLDLSGLENLTHIGEDLAIYSNPSLVSLNGIDNLEHIELVLDIRDNDDLIHIDALDQPLNVGSIRISNNPVLSNLEGLLGIETIYFMEIKGNTALINLNGLNTITNADYYIEISGNDNLLNLDALSSLNSTEYIYIRSNDALINVNGLSGLSTVDGLIVSFNSSLLNIDSLINLQEVSVISIEHNELLTSLEGLQNLTQVMRINITYNPNLLNLNGLNNIINLTDLLVHTNQILSDFCSLENLIVGGGLIGEYHVGNNAYNPTQQDIIDGNCSL